MFQSRYRVRNNWSVNGHYTLQLAERRQLRGRGDEPAGRRVADRQLTPKRSRRTRYYPDGRLQNFQRNRAAHLEHLQLRHGPGGRSLGLRPVAGRRRAGVQPGDQESAPITGTQTGDSRGGRLSRRAGAAAPLLRRRAGHGAFPATACSTVDINYNVPVFRSLRPWVKFDIYNLFDNRKLIGWNTTIDPEHRRPDGRAGTGDHLHQGLEFREGDRQHGHQSELHRASTRSRGRSTARRPAAARSGWPWASGSNSARSSVTTRRAALHASRPSCAARLFSVEPIHVISLCHTMLPIVCTIRLFNGIDRY